MPGPEDELAVLTDASNLAQAEKPTHPDKPLHGILLIIAGCAMQCFADGATKYLAQSMAVTEASWLRYVFTVALVFVVLTSTGFRRGLRSEHPGFQLMRSILQVLSGLFFLFALRSVPIVNVTSTVFSAPLMVTALSIFLLGERVGPRRWFAAIIGLVGVLLIMRPGTSMFNPALLWAVAAAVLFAIVLIMTRKISVRESSVTTMVYSTVVGFVVFTVLVPFDWVVPTWPQVVIGFATGVIYTAVNWCIIIAYRYADASVLAPYSYFQIVFIAIVGIVAFQEVPDGWTITGIGIIIASGLYNAQQERSRRAGLGCAAKA